MNRRRACRRRRLNLIVQRTLTTIRTPTRTEDARLSHAALHVAALPKTTTPRERLAAIVDALRASQGEATRIFEYVLITSISTHREKIHPEARIPTCRGSAATCAASGGTSKYKVNIPFPHPRPLLPYLHRVICSRGKKRATTPLPIRILIAPLFAAAAAGAVPS